MCCDNDHRQLTPFPSDLGLPDFYHERYAPLWSLIEETGLDPADVAKACTNFQSHATSNPTSFAMVGALAALTGAEADVEAMIGEYAARRELLIPRLNALPGVSCAPPHGAFYAFPHVADAYRPGCDDSISFAERLLEEAAVAVVPGSAFGNDDHVRISFACSRETLEEGLGRMARVLGG